MARPLAIPIPIIAKSLDLVRDREILKSCKLNVNAFALQIAERPGRLVF